MSLLCLPLRAVGAALLCSSSVGLRLGLALAWRLPEPPSAAYDAAAFAVGALIGSASVLGELGARMKNCNRRVS